MKKITYVTTHYKLPEHRLQDFLAWNERMFLITGASLIVVMDRPPLRLPEFARAIVFPEPLPIFNLSKTSNYGIRTAINDGAEIIVKTDPDCLITLELARKFAAITPGLAIAPIYHMAPSINHARRGSTICRKWTRSRGTVGMAATDWDLVCGYDQRMQGYGPEDGDLCDRINLAKIKTERAINAPLYHIAHDKATTQLPNKRTDHWGRDGINPDNRAEIAKIRSRRDWHDKNWGIFPPQ